MDSSTTTGNRVVSGLYKRIITPELRIHNEMNCVHPHLNPNVRIKTYHGVRGGGGTMRPPKKSHASSIIAPLNGEQVMMSKRQTQAAELKKPVHGYESGDFNPTVRFQKAPLPSMPLNQRYSVPSSGTSRVVPISNKTLAIPSSPGMGDISQRGRLAAEEKALEQCRALKRTSNIISYRIDKSYYMSGTQIPVKNRYEVDMTELKALRGFMESRNSSAVSRGSSRKSAKFGNHYIYSRYLRSPDSSALSGRFSTPLIEEGLEFVGQGIKQDLSGDLSGKPGNEHETNETDSAKRPQSKQSEIDSLEGLDIENVTPLTPSCDTPANSLPLGGASEGAESRTMSQLEEDSEVENETVINSTVRPRMNSGKLIKGTVGSVIMSQSNDELIDSEDSKLGLDDQDNTDMEDVNSKIGSEPSQKSFPGKLHKGTVGSVKTIEISFADDVESAEVAKSGIVPSPSLTIPRRDSAGSISKKQVSGPLTVHGQNFKMGHTTLKGNSNPDYKLPPLQSELLEKMSIEDIDKYSKLGDKLRKIGDKEKEEKEKKEAAGNAQDGNEKKTKLDPERYKPKIGKRSVIMVTSDPHAKKSSCKASDLFHEEADGKLTVNEESLETLLSENEPAQGEEASEDTERLKYTFITEKQEQAFKKIFEDIDHDKNGRVTMTEIRHRMFANASKKDVNHLMQVFDLNKDKTVDIKEFVTLCGLNDKIRGFRTENDDMSLALDLEKMAQYIVLFKEMFNMVDDDGDGKLHIDEVLAMVSAALEAEQSFDMGNVADVLKYIERDEFGYINFVGFLAYIPFFLRLHKTVVESTLSIQEVEKARNRIMKKFTQAAEKTAETQN